MLLALLICAYQPVEEAVVVSRRWWEFADGASGGVRLSVQAARGTTRSAIG
jgi:hypothetical protein